MMSRATSAFGKLKPVAALQTVAKSATSVSGDEDNVNERMIWVDLEMSGLEVSKERIIEMAVCVTDSKLTKIAKGPNLIIHQTDELMNAMDEWNTEHHGNSGLTQSVKESKISEAECETQMLDFIKQYTNPGKSPLAGNSIYMDKMFLMKYMPRFCDHLHYRLVDVSTIKELAKRWQPDLVSKAPKKGMKHRAKDDILDSINELKHYQPSMFV